MVIPMEQAVLVAQELLVHKKEQHPGKDEKRWLQRCPVRSERLRDEVDERVAQQAPTAKLTSSEASRRIRDSLRESVASPTRETRLTKETLPKLRSHVVMHVPGKGAASRA
jgi:hypothetical protein